MRIAFLSPFPPFRGGIAQFSAALYDALAACERVEAVKAYTFSRQYPDFLFPGKTQYADDTKEAERIGAVASLDSLNPVSYAKTARAIAAFNPDVLLLSYWMPFFAPALGNVAKRLRKKGVKVVTVLHNLVPHEKRVGDRQLTRYFLKQCDGFVVLGDSVERDLRRLAPEAPFLRHPHPIYERFGGAVERRAACATLGIPEETRNVLFFGLIRAYKGLDLLIKAFGLLDERYHLTIAGESYEPFDKYAELLAANRNAERVKVFNRYVADPEVSAFFSAADVCALPYRSATQSGVVSVAQQFRLPVVVTDVGGLRKSVEGEGSGLVVPNAEPDAFAEALSRYFEEGMKERFQANIDAFRTRYNWHTLAEGAVGLAEGLH